MILEKYYKNASGIWELTDTQDLENGSVHLQSIDFEVRLKDVYARVATI